MIHDSRFILWFLKLVYIMDLEHFEHIDWDTLGCIVRKIGYRVISILVDRVMYKLFNRDNVYLFL